MSTLISLLIGVPLGIASSILAWWMLAHAIRPSLSWHEPRFVLVPGSETAGYENLAIRLKNDSKRDAIDITIHGELRVDHMPTKDGVRRTLVRFPLNSPWMPLIKNEAQIRVEQQNIPDWEWDRLCGRVGVSKRNLKLVMQECERSTIRFYALAYDRFSGAKKIFVKEFEFKEIQDLSVNVVNTSEMV
jgi:hypothetical protein